MMPSDIQAIAFALALGTLVHCSSGAAVREQADASPPPSAWLCYCDGKLALTCVHEQPICAIDDPSKDVADAGDFATCACARQSICVPDADCIEVH
jgi:hypothetical protein